MLLAQIPSACRASSALRVKLCFLQSPSRRLLRPRHKSGAMAVLLRADAQIELTLEEARLRRLLLDVASFINPSKPSELRFTGGWVRDKLLGYASHDIDVAINDLTGYQFGRRLKDYLDDPSKLAKYKASDEAASNTDLVSLHKIEANPERSKHLETVTTKIFGFDVDLVNLRKETYTDDSRNPQMEFGTPKEDALRRDATINSLFYNLVTEQVEDLTGQGISDLKKGVIRTPLEPFQTFKDDPLRVLRLIRFAARFGYDVDPSALEAMKARSIRDALRSKISRERVGVEVDKMMKEGAAAEADRSFQTYRAMSYIVSAGLYETIFSDPDSDSKPRGNTSDWVQVVHTFLSKHPFDNTDDILSETLVKSFDRYHIIWLLGSMTPWAYNDQSSKNSENKKPPSYSATAAARKGLKATNKFCEIINASVHNLEDIIDFKDSVVERKSSPKRSLADIDHEVDPMARHVLGTKVRQWGPLWTEQVLFSMLVEMQAVFETQNDDNNDVEQALLKIEDGYAKLLCTLKAENLLQAYELKPLVDGKALSTALGLAPGPWMKEALDVIIQWQLRHPSAVDPNDAIEAIKTKQSELHDLLLSHLLHKIIKPLFVKTQTRDGITRLGRRKLDTSIKLPKRYESDDNEDSKKPWKETRNAYAVDILEWVSHQLDARSTEKFWPLLIPPTLTLVDDIDSHIKARGCNILYNILHATSPDLLRRTGLSDVFQTAIEPCLSYLPSLSSVEASIEILDSAYPALFLLIRKGFSSSELRDATSEGHSRNSTTNTGKAYVEPDNADSVHRRLNSPRSRLLSDILHQNLLPSVNHVLESHPAVAVALLGHLKTCIEQLDDQVIMHLVYLLPFISEILENPMIGVYPELISQTAKVTQAVLANGWVMAGVWRANFIQPLSSGWLAIHAESKDGEAEAASAAGVVEARKQLVITFKMLLSAIEAVNLNAADGLLQDYGVADAPGQEVIDIRKELESLIEANPKLAGLYYPKQV